MHLRLIKQLKNRSALILTCILCELSSSRCWALDLKSERKARTVSLPSFFKALIIDFIFTPLLLRLTARAYHFEEPFSTTDRDSAESSAHDPAAAASPKTSASASAHTRALTQPRPSQTSPLWLAFSLPWGRDYRHNCPAEQEENVIQYNLCVTRTESWTLKKLGGKKL